MVFLAFDFGTQSWGCAVGDDITQTATALCGIKAQGGEPCWDEIQQIVKAWRPDAVVIGYPLKANGERFKLTDQVDIAISAIQKQLGLRVIKADERLTTVEAKASIYGSKGRKGLVKGNIDAESAKCILLNWFEHNNMFNDNIV